MTADLLHPILESGFFITSGVEGSCRTWSRDLGYHHPISVGVSGGWSPGSISATFPRLGYTTGRHVGVGPRCKGWLKVSPSSFSSSAWPPLVLLSLTYKRGVQCLPFCYKRGPQGEWLKGQEVVILQSSASEAQRVSLNKVRDSSTV